jgi:hypothetical protein
VRRLFHYHDWNAGGRCRTCPAKRCIHLCSFKMQLRCQRAALLGQTICGTHSAKQLRRCAADALIDPSGQVDGIANGGIHPRNVPEVLFTREANGSNDAGRDHDRVPRPAAVSIFRHQLIIGRTMGEDQRRDV